MGRSTLSFYNFWSIFGKTGALLGRDLVQFDTSSGEDHHSTTSPLEHTRFSITGSRYDLLCVDEPDEKDEDF